MSLTLLGIKNILCKKCDSLKDSKAQQFAKAMHAVLRQLKSDYLQLGLKASWAAKQTGTRLNTVLPQIVEKQKLGYLRLIGEFNKSLMELTINGPSVMAIDDLRKKIENVGVDLNLNDINR